MVLDPAHGGTTRAHEGLAAFARAKSCWTLRHRCAGHWKRKDFKIVQTHQGNEDPSFDDRSAIANAQSGAVFVPDQIWDLVHYIQTLSAGANRGFFHLARSQPKPQ